MNIDWSVVRALMGKDLRAIRRSKAIILPMMIVPVILLVILPLVLGLAARSADAGSVSQVMSKIPGGLGRPILELPEKERLIVLVSGYLLAPLFLIVPLMVASVFAADAFAGERERRTLEGLLHLPIRERDLFISKVLTAFIPAVVVSWAGFVLFAIVANAVAWPVLHRVFIPTPLWLMMIFWMGPGIAAFGMGVMVRISARVQTTQEANQLGGAVVMMIIFAAGAQSTGVLLLNVPIAFLMGLVIWAAATWMLVRGAQRFTRDEIAARS